jgi:hypothetical protein
MGTEETVKHGQACPHKDEMNKTLLRGIGCVLAGMVTTAVPAIVTDVVLEKTGVFPSFAEQMEHGLHVATCSSVPPSVSSSVSSGPS